MSKKSYIMYWVSGLIIGLFILPSLLQWLGIPPFVDVLEFVFGEPNLVNRIVVGSLLVISLIWIGRIVYKGYKNLA